MFPLYFLRYQKASFRRWLRQSIRGCAQRRLEIDGLVLLESDLTVGEMVRTRVTGAMAYDLTAVVDK